MRAGTRPLGRDMEAHHTPVLKATPILDLRPTQMTLGMHEVKRKRAVWAQRKERKILDYLSRHMVPAVLGPGDAYYIIDHHHLVRAILEEGGDSVFVAQVADLRGVKGRAFWTYMEFRGWTHPYGADGERCDHADLPTTIEGLIDDPYRSLSGELRNIGGYAKDAQPYAEFVWADFLRPRIKRKAIRKDFDAALGEAMRLAKSGEAEYLPGWCAPKVEEAEAVGRGKSAG
jgi:hypothetical protein